MLLDGVDLARLEGDQVRSVVGLLTQESHVFDTSIRENLLLARPGASDLKLWRALYRARLGVFVEKLPEGLDTMVGEHGARLSGGERQRLAFARLLLADRDVLVLDEPTEHLDEETGRALLRTCSPRPVAVPSCSSPTGPSWCRLTYRDSWCA